MPFLEEHDLEFINSIYAPFVPYMKYLVVFYLSIPFLAYGLLPFVFASHMPRSKRSIAIFVLGDLGHSPRMCYHAKSFARLGYAVSLCGYVESDPSDNFQDEPVDIIEIPVIKNRFKLPFVLYAFQKIVMQIFALFGLFFELRGVNIILIQNPPSLPILIIAVVFIKLFSRRTQLIIDWHNLNYSILALKFGRQSHPLVKILRLYEKYVGRLADYHFTVTKQMKKFLVENFNYSADLIEVVYDRPNDTFAPLEELPETKLEILNHPLFEDLDKTVDYKFLVTATSYTPDEDLSILVQALAEYDKSDVVGYLCLIVTGKGPLKEEFHKWVRDANFASKITVKTAWLSLEDYPLILAIADLGISLHTSSSGLDLPMKILDFFGCGVPVISLDFPAIDELVGHEVNGLITGHDKDSLSRASSELCRLIKKSLSNKTLYSKIKNGALSESKNKWHRSWRETLESKFKYRA